ncbi:MAG TPA: ribonuclease P protein component, partial [Rhodanobacteraceae bacterium]|nr:ribonuclease P protein component [Rhodanobacteraceae bacterium]
ASPPDRVADGMKAAGLPPSVRLHSRADFARIQRSRGSLGGRWFRLRHEVTERGGARLGLAVSRKVSKRAVDRNRIKRVVRESFRHHHAALPARDILVVARTEAVAASNADLRAELASLWTRLAALKPTPADGTIVG